MPAHYLHKISNMFRLYGAPPRIARAFNDGKLDQNCQNFPDVTRPSRSAKLSAVYENLALGIADWIELLEFATLGTPKSAFRLPAATLCHHPLYNRTFKEPAREPSEDLM
jgi:hypothetical protein